MQIIYVIKDFKEDLQMAKKHMTRCPTPLAPPPHPTPPHWKQFKTTIRYHCTPTRMARVKRQIKSIREDLEKLEPSCAAGGNVK